MRVHSRFGGLILVAFALMGGLAWADVPQPDPQSPTDTAPKVPLMPYPASSAARTDEVVAKDTDPSLATLAPAPTAPGGLDEVVIAPRRTVVLSSQSSWENGFESLSAAFKQLDEIVMGAGLDVQGRPFAVFTQTDEAGFHYDAMLPVASDGADAKAEEALQQAAAEYASAEEKRSLPAVKFAQSPSGKAYRLVHAGPYDDIDTAYEAITTYLDNKDILVNDIFIEEYVMDLTKPDDAALEVYIYVQPKEPPQADPAKESQDAPQAAVASGAKQEVLKVAPEKEMPARAEKLEEVVPQAEEVATPPAAPEAPEIVPEKPAAGEAK